MLGGGCTGHFDLHAAWNTKEYPAASPAISMLRIVRGIGLYKLGPEGPYKCSAKGALQNILLHTGGLVKPRGLYRTYCCIQGLGKISTGIIVGVITLAPS